MVQHARLASNNPTPVFPFFCGEHSNKSKAGTWPALNGNKTPCSAIVSVKGYFFQGTVNIEKGTIHNNKCEGKWQKGYFGAEKGQWTMSMQEVLPTNKGFFVYQGTLDQSGTVVKGTFTWSCFPQKVRGCFTFSLVKHAIDKT